MSSWSAAFQSPGPSHAACPFWFWNGDLEEGELLRQLGLMDEKGVRGFVIHPRAGLTVPYLSEAWFERCRLVIDEAARRDMKVWIYDEDNWPSGYAGGRVVQRDVRFRGQNLVAERHYVDEPGLLELKLVAPDEVRAVLATRIGRVERHPPQPLVLFPKSPGNDWRDTTAFAHRYEPGRPVRLAHEHGLVRWDAPGGKWCVFVLRQQPTEWYGCYSQHPYVDLMNKDAVRAFIEETHERYYERFAAHFGEAVLGFFIDEPAFYNNFWDRNPSSVPFTHDFAKEFETRRGYDLLSWAAALWEELGPKTRAVRVDYWRTVSELFEERCFQQIADWCAERRVALTGHLEWEEWIYTSVRHGGSPFHALRPMQVPAVDKIDEITEKISEKLVASIAHAHGRPRVLSETFALTGWKLAPPYMKRIVDQQYVRGVNWLSCHGFYYSTADWRKFECPPSEFFQNPWWEHSRPLWDYVARLSAALSSGRHVAPVALYYPVEHAWATLTPDAPPACDGTVWETWQLPCPDHPTQRADLSMQRTAQQLLAGQFDFDFVDHAILAAARSDDGRLVIGDERFQALVIPALDVIDRNAMARALAFAEHGGTAIFMNRLPAHGSDGDLPAQWTAIRAALVKQRRPFLLPVGTGWIGYVPEGEFGVRTLLQRCISPDVRVVPTLAVARRGELAHARIHTRGISFPAAAEALRYHCRDVDGERLYFIFNESNREFTATLHLCGAASAVEHDACTGHADALLAEAVENGRLAVTLTWRPWQARLISLGAAGDAPAPLAAPEHCQTLDCWHLALDDHRYDGPLASWHELGWPSYSGRGGYETTFAMAELRSDARYEIDLGQVFETARLWLNDKLIGDRVWSPYVFDVSAVIQSGTNRLRVEVANTNTNAFEKVERVSGLLGPVALNMRATPRATARVARDRRPLTTAGRRPRVDDGVNCLRKMIMTPRERVLAVIRRQAADRPPVDLWHTEAVSAALRERFSVSSDIELYRALRLDKLVWCNPPYRDPHPAPTDANLLRSQWGALLRPQQAGAETYHEFTEAPLRDYDTVDRLDDYPYWPDPDDFDYAAMAAGLADCADEYVVLGPWVSLYEVYCQMRGLEAAMKDLAQRPDYVQAVLDRLEHIQAEIMRRCFAAAGDAIQLAFVSDDMGSQDGLLISPRMWDKFFKDRLARWCNLIHESDKRVFYHSDGAIAPLLPRLIDAGIDVLNPIQHACPGMACDELKAKFGDRLIFHGGVDNQSVLPFGAVDDVRRETRACLETLGGDGQGYIVCSCHNVQAGTPLDNILAMIAAVQEA